MMQPVKGDVVVRDVDGVAVRRVVLNATGRYVTLMRLDGTGKTYYTRKELEQRGYTLEESGAQVTQVTR